MDEKLDPALVLDFEQLIAYITARGNEVKIEPSLERISYLMDILGSPQLAFDSVHVAGTNGKTSTSRMIESLLSETGLAVGLMTSPHMHDYRERIRVFKESVSMEVFVESFQELIPFIDMVDAALGQKLSFFEILTALGYMVFAETPVAVAVVEVGLGGGLDATNVINPAVGVITPIGLDHQSILGDTYQEIAVAKAGIIKPGMTVVVAQQHPEVLPIILEKAAAEGAQVLLENRDYEVVSRQPAVGGQTLTIRGIAGIYDEVFVPLHGEHQAQNAATALVAVEAFFGAQTQGRALDAEFVQEGFAKTSSPGRMEVVRRGPTVILDAAHNPHGMAALLNSLDKEFDFDRLVFVLAAFADKDVVGLGALVEPVADQIVLTEAINERALDVNAFAEKIAHVVNPGKISTHKKMADAIDAAIAMCDAWDAEDLTAAVVVTGSVATVSQARAMFGKRNTQ